MRHMVVMVIAATACHPAGDREAVHNRSTPTLTIVGEHIQVGHGKEVSLWARVNADEPEQWTVTWNQVWGPRAKITKNEDGLLKLITPSLPSWDIALERRGWPLPLTAAQAGRMVFRVEAFSAGLRVERAVEVIPSYPTASWPRMARGVTYYFPDPESAGELVVRGRIDEEGLGGDGTVKLSSPVTSWHSFRLRDGGETKVRSGEWIGSKECGRVDCHPLEYRGWRETGHASIFMRGISGELPTKRGRYERHCIACHTLGYQPDADNAGFDDAAKKTGWTFPEQLSRQAWYAMPDALRERANVQCEHCHGPGWFWVGYGGDICAQCHDHPPDYLTYSQWSTTSMSRSHESLEGYADDLSCGVCHLAAKFLESTRGHRSTSQPQTELETTPRGVTCPVCHDPHGKDCENQLRFCGAIEIPGTTYDAGQGALCILCHSGDADIFTGSFPRPYVPGSEAGGEAGHAQTQASYIVDPDNAPHASQALILTGRGGRFLDISKVGAPQYSSYAHMWVDDTCSGCHFEGGESLLSTMSVSSTSSGNHAFRLAQDDSEARSSQGSRCWSEYDVARIVASTKTRACTSCHGEVENLNIKARGDYDGSGTIGSLIEEVAGLMRILGAEIEQHLRAADITGVDGKRGVTFTITGEKMVVADSDCLPITREEGEQVYVSQLEPELAKAIFNYLMVVRDGSAGIHNPQYVTRLLQSTILGLENARGAEVFHRWKALTDARHRAP